MMTTGEIITLLQARGYSFNRALGQHFLADSAMVDAIVELSRVDEHTNVLEIGPGAGVLTGPLAKRAKKVVAVELDRGLLPVLETTLRGTGAVVVRGDILNQDISQLAQEHFPGERFDVVSNLPYSITTPLLTRLVQGDLPIDCMTLMVQAEAAERILATQGKGYGPLALRVAYHTQAQRVLEVARGCFVPPPHVDSAVLTMRTRPHDPVASDEGFLFSIIARAFMMRRKTLVNNLKAMQFPSELLAKTMEDCGIDPRARAEQISLNQFISLANGLKSDA